MKNRDVTISKKLWQLLNHDQHRMALVLLCQMIIGMVMETLGIGMVIPALALVSQGDLVIKYPFLKLWLNSFGSAGHKQLIIVGMLTLFGVYAVKTLFLAFLAWRQAYFIFELQARLSQKLFAGYLRQPYTFHLQRNSAQLIRNTIGQVSDLTSVVQQGLMLTTEIFVLLGISALLLTVEPLGSLLVGSILGLSAWGFNHITRGHILRWGEARQYHEGLRIQHLQQGLGGAKDVKILGRENDFLEQYEWHNIGSARVGQRQTALQALPRLWLELLAVTGLAALALVIIGQGKPLETLLPTLGLFAAAAFRLMPSVNRIIGGIQSVRFSLPVINTLHSEIQLIDTTIVPQSSQPLPFKNTLVLDHINFQYPNAEAYALREVSLSIPRGTSVGFIGSSGAGKSTLVDIILGLLTPVSGAVKVDGIDIQKTLRGWQDQIGYVPQSIYLTDDTLRRNIAFGLPSGQINEVAIKRAICAAQLDDFIDSLPDGLETLVGERGIRLSGGQRQRIGIARALYHDPAVLVLDEATSALDTTTERGVMEAIRVLQGTKTVIIVAHRLSTVQYCGRLYRLERGRVVVEESHLEVIHA